MTNEELKLEAIKKAYGEHWRSNKITDNGWFLSNDPNSDKPQQNGFELSEVDILSSLIWRPKSLAGIENNRGWILLDRVTPNEITYKGDIWIEDKSGEIIFVNEDEFIPLDFAVAYQPVLKPKKRIY